MRSPLPFLLDLRSVGLNEHRGEVILLLGSIGDDGVIQVRDDLWGRQVSCCSHYSFPFSTLRIVHLDRSPIRKNHPWPGVPGHLHEAETCRGGSEANEGRMPSGKSMGTELLEVILRT